MSGFRHRVIMGPDGEGYTEVWVDGRYSRIQAVLTATEALQRVRASRLAFTFKP